MNYYEYEITVSQPQPFSEIIMSALGEIGFDSFVDIESGFLAYIPENLENQSEIIKVLDYFNDDVKTSFTRKFIKDQNWNEEWEKNFDPVEVEDDILIKAHFHKIDKKYPYEILITPKMSFGTGHHSTTWLMMKNMLNFDFKNKSVLDMGTGTGVLAILAKMLGATEIHSIDIDEWSIENAAENYNLNHCYEISIEKGDASILGETKYDVILANINRNVLLADLPKYNEILNEKGSIFLSGFYEEDVPMLKEKAYSLGLKIENKMARQNWCCLKLNK